MPQEKEILLKTVQWVSILWQQTQLLNIMSDIMLRFLI